ncbi:yeats family-domain-containing protein [Xylariaceae sp. FL1272]|nr:yeats family-domain-containing protein [Xylariaceae sp. FL1272]
MAPPAGKRVKGVQIFRPFVYGTTARPFNDTDNPRPAGVPADHTHSWKVFVKGPEDTDVFYWLRRVQFKLHESIPNHLRTIDAETIIKENEAGAKSGKKPQKEFAVHETGWGEFEITIKLYYDGKSGEKPQTLYHHLRLHPYGRTEAEREAMRSTGEVTAHTYEEQIFNEPFEEFHKILTSGARDKGLTGGKGKGKGKTSQLTAAPGDVKERSAMIPLTTRPGEPFSRETEAAEVKKLVEARELIDKQIAELNKVVKAKESQLAEFKAENKAAVAPAANAPAA